MDVQITPACFAVFDGLENWGGDGKHTGICAGYPRDIVRFGSEMERSTSAIHFIAIVAAVALLAQTVWNASNIALITYDIGCGFKRQCRLGSNPVGRAGSQTNDTKRAGICHDRLPFPGTSTIAK